MAEKIEGDINPGDREHVFTDEGVAMHPSRLKVFRLYGGDRWHVSIDALNSLDDLHDAAITISAAEARALGQAFIGAFVPEVEPVAWLDKTGAFWTLDDGSLDHLSTTYGPLAEVYAHPPVTAEPAREALDVIATTLGREVCTEPPDESDFELARSIMVALAAAGWAVKTVDSAAEPVTAPSVDLVEGMNVEEWADKAEKNRVAALNMTHVLRAAHEALLAHGFTSDTLESQTLAESIHALAGRGAPSVCGATVGPVPKLDGERFICALASGHDGDHEAIDGTWFVDSIARYPAPSVEQIAEVLIEQGCCAPVTGLAEEIHALYGTPGDAGELTDARERAARYANDAESRAGKAEARVDELVAELEESDEMRISLANRVTEVENIARAEVERYKAALEAAEALGWAQENLRANDAAMKAAQDGFSDAYNLRQKRKAEYDAARAAVEAETSEEAGA